MSSSQTDFEPLSINRIVAMDRCELVERLLHFHGKFHFDFTEQFLESKPTSQLRHILVAASRHAARNNS